MKTRIAKIRTLCLGAALLLGMSTQAQADDGFLVFNTFAYHFENSDERNDFTPGIGWEYSPTQKFGFHVGTLADSFGYQATYAGVNYATRRYFNNRVRFIIGATVVNKQFRLARFDDEGNVTDDGVDTRLLPFPVIEFALSERAVINVSGSPSVDFGEQRNNPVIWFQAKIGLN